jgi:hypothetical protein
MEVFMSFICKGVCTRYKAKKPKEGRYASGQKRCNFCNVFLIGMVFGVLAVE